MPDEGFQDKDVPPVGKLLKKTTVDVASANRKIRRSKRTPATAEDPENIEVPNDFVAEQGRKLFDQWYLGKALGTGFQGAVFLVSDKKEKNKGRVFKEVHNTKGDEDTIGLQREWLIGRQLNTLAEDDGFLPGFMHTGSAVITRSGKFRGLVLEKLEGKDITKRFEDPDFCDIDYVTEMLSQVMTALNRADVALGFKHRDMRIENVMEHRIGSVEDNTSGLAPGFGPKVPLDGLHFKIIDYGHSFIVREEARDLQKKQETRQLYRLLPQFPKWHLTERIYRWLFRERDDVWRFCRSVSQAMEGRTWPKQDERKVRHVVKLIHHSTGFKPRAYYATSLHAGLRKKGPAGQLVEFGGALFPLRWLRTMIHAYLFPGRPSMRPKEALKFLAQMPA